MSLKHSNGRGCFYSSRSVVDQIENVMHAAFFPSKSTDKSRECHRDCMDHETFFGNDIAKVLLSRSRYLRTPEKTLLQMQMNRHNILGRFMIRRPRCRNVA